MRVLGLAGRHRRRGRRTTVADPHAHVRADLIGWDFAPDASAVDARWCGDVTYIATGQGWLYPATVIDIASRRVVGWAAADHLRTDLVAEALRQTYVRRRPAGRVIFHSDRGRQRSSGGVVPSAPHRTPRKSVGTGQQLI
ncbi:transposase [Spongiactinospora sp. 9N601]|uniref:transposase n=1 Tax=Spongiactinospora sp. 9N601 TaxID=3375149 RepID=UPI0037AEE9AA